MDRYYFETWSADSAYICGFCQAAGFEETQNIFKLIVKKKDKYILKQIAKKLNIELDNQTCSLTFHYKKVSSISDIPLEFFKDFVRGCLDGNGEIQRISKNRLNLTFYSKDQDFLFELLDNLEKQFEVNGGSIDKKSLSLKFGKKDSLKIGSFLYKDNPELFLLRKRKKFY